MSPTSRNSSRRRIPSSSSSRKFTSAVMTSRVTLVTYYFFHQFLKPFKKKLQIVIFETKKKVEKKIEFLLHRLPSVDKCIVFIILLLEISSWTRFLTPFRIFPDFSRKIRPRGKEFRLSITWIKIKQNKKKKNTGKYEILPPHITVINYSEINHSINDEVRSREHSAYAASAQHFRGK